MGVETKKFRWFPPDSACGVEGGETCASHTPLSQAKAEMKRNVSRGGEARKPTPFYMGDPAQQNRSDTMHRSL